MLPYRPAEHCQHVGRSGGGMCLERNYTDVVTNSPYATTFLAPIANLPDDPDVDKLPDDVQKELIKILMLSVSPMTVAWFPVAPLVLFVALWLSALITRFLLLKSMAFRKLSPSVQRTTTTYPLSIFWTTVAMVLQLIAADCLVGNYSLRGIGMIRPAGVIIVALYLFELIYRDSIRPPLLIHHLLTIFSICFVVICPYFCSCTSSRLKGTSLTALSRAQVLKSRRTRVSSPRPAFGSFRLRSSRASSSACLPVRPSTTRHLCPPALDTLALTSPFLYALHVRPAQLGP